MIDIRLPQINGATEKEQLGQIRSYLFQLAEQLQFALKDVDTTQANVVSLNAKSLIPAVRRQGTALTNPAEAVDFIVEQGTSDIWEYRKWHSGKVECWGKRDIEVILDIEWGSLWHNSVDGYAFPTGLFTSAPHCQVSLDCRDTPERAWVAIGGITAKDYTPLVVITSPVKKEVATGFYLLYYAVGNWK